MKLSRLALPLLAALAALAAPALAQKEIVVWHAYRAEEKAALEKVVAALQRGERRQGRRR